MIDDPSYDDSALLASSDDGNGSATSLNADAGESELLPLSEAHRKMLVDGSAISPTIIRERGYRTITGSSELYAIGFAQAQYRLGSGLFIPTYDVRGKPHSAQFRADKPRCSRDGKPIKYETPQGSSMYVDVLPRNAELLRSPEATLWITEGVKKADSLSSLGLLAVALFGVWNWRGRNEYGGLTSLSDWDEIALKDRQVYVCFDNDYREKSSVLMATHRLAAFLRRRGAIVSFINLPEGDKLGIDDFIAQGHTADDLLQLKTAALPELEKQTQSDALLAIAQSRLQLICTQSDERLAVVSYADGHREVFTIGERGSSLRDWLIMEYRREHRNRLPSTTALAQVMEALAAECRRYGEHVDTFVRLASDGGRLYLDLATPTWEAVEIDCEGWRVVKRPPVYFRRPPGMQPLPIPVAGGSLGDIAELLHLDLDSDGAMLIQGWLIGTLHPQGPYPHLNLQGQQGSGKTTATKMLRHLIDPNISPTRRQPKEEEDLILAAMNGHIVAIENVSGLPLWLSDLLCGLSTGIGLSRRKKFTDADEALFYATRPAIINGIAAVAVRGDLIDRLIAVELPTIREQTRKRESEIWAPFHEKHPAILGALLDAVSTALRRQDEVVIKDLPRMADFAHWVEAAAPALGWEPGQFLELFNAQREDSLEVEIEASPVAAALLEYLKKHERIEAASASDILLCLEPIHTRQGTRRPAKAWPENPQSLGHAFKRIAPAMRQRGYILERVPGSRRDGRKWRVIPIFVGDDVEPNRHQHRHHEATSSPTSSPNNSLSTQGLGKYGDNGDDGDDVFPSYSVRESSQREKNIPLYEQHLSQREKNVPLVEQSGNTSSPSSPSSPCPSGNTHFESIPEPDVPWPEDSSQLSLLPESPPPEVDDPSRGLGLGPYAPEVVNGKYLYRI
jgi:hypothetical protein